MSYMEYDKNGYIRIDKILECGKPFIFVTGGRGTGKTYGALKYVIECKKTFMWMRRRQDETDLINKPEFSPFKVINADMGLNIQPHKISKGSAAYIDEDTGHCMGYSCALSTISTMRGFDASDVEIIIYDEFIPEAHKVAIKEEGQALLQAYETINRNRELMNQEPVQLLALSNSNRMNNEIYHDLGLIETADRMKREGIREYISDERGLALFFMDDSPISGKKRETALYKFSAGTAFSEMALNNSFSDFEDRRTAKRNLREYIPVASVGKLNMYRHKSNGTYYFSPVASGAFKYKFSESAADKLAFIRKYPLLWEKYLNRKIEFYDYAAEAEFLRLY